MSDPRPRIREFIVRHFLFGEDQNLTNDASFLENGFIDSTGVLELVAFLESEFQIKVSDDELIPDNLDSIDAIAQFLKQKPPSSAAA